MISPASTLQKHVECRKIGLKMSSSLNPLCHRDTAESKAMVLAGNAHADPAYGEFID